MHSILQTNLLPLLARTATATGAQVGTGVSTKPITQDTAGFTRHMRVFLNVTAYTSGTLDLTVQGSPDNGTTWYTLTPSSDWTQVSGTGKQERRYEGPLPQLIRAVGTGASTPIFTYSVDAVLGG